MDPLPWVRKGLVLKKKKKKEKKKFSKTHKNEDTNKDSRTKQIASYTGSVHFTLNGKTSEGCVLEEDNALQGSLKCQGSVLVTLHHRHVNPANTTCLGVN